MDVRYNQFGFGFVKVLKTDDLFQLKCRWGKDDHKTFDMAGGIQNLKLDSSSSTVQMNQIYPIPVQSYQPYQPYSQPYIVSKWFDLNNL